MNWNRELKIKIKYHEIISESIGDEIRVCDENIITILHVQLRINERIIQKLRSQLK